MASSPLSTRPLRPFGTSAEDLAIDFHRLRRPDLVTALLHRCGRTDDGRQVDEAALRRMPIGARIEALVALAACTMPGPFEWRVRCDRSGCEEDCNFELSADQILSFGDALRDDETVTTSLDGRAAVLRRPTADDQSRWSTPSGDIEIAAMMRSMLVSPSLDDLQAAGTSLDAIARDIDAAMDRFDPLLGFHLTVVCPRCGNGVEAHPDLAGAALDRLARAQRARIEDVHRLASCYHWGEREILDMPSWRRERYLEIIDAELA